MAQSTTTSQTSQSAEVNVDTSDGTDSETSTSFNELHYKPFLLVSSILVISSIVFIRIWQGLWWFPEGLDSSSWEFTYYWMSLLYVEFAVLGVTSLWIFWAYRNPCPVCEEQRNIYGRILPEHENEHIGKLWAIITMVAIFGIGVGYFAEQDASWHQVVIRDTTFTPSHIPLFFYTFPMAMVLGFHASWYAYQRLHHLYVDENQEGIPVAYFLFPAGGLVATMNVALNEFGHSTWITEELFVQPFHWPFAWAVYFFISGLALVLPSLKPFYQNLDALTSSPDSFETD